MKMRDVHPSPLPVRTSDKTRTWRDQTTDHNRDSAVPSESCSEDLSSIRSRPPEDSRIWDSCRPEDSGLLRLSTRAQFKADFEKTHQAKHVSGPGPDVMQPQWTEDPRPESCQVFQLQNLQDVLLHTGVSGPARRVPL